MVHLLLLYFFASILHTYYLWVVLLLLLLLLNFLKLFMVPVGHQLCCVLFVANIKHSKGLCGRLHTDPAYEAVRRRDSRRLKALELKDVKDEPTVDLCRKWLHGQEIIPLLYSWAAVTTSHFETKYFE